jgi:phosphoribosylanthranilate isomerase
MSNTLIKICGVSTPDIAEKTAHTGANFIGLIFHPASSRYVTSMQAKDIVIATRNGGAEPVAVFVNQNADEMQQICEDANIKIIQLHGSPARQQHHLLPSHYQRIYVQPVTTNGRLLNINESGLSACDRTRDFLLFDSMTPGQGRLFNWQKFKYDNYFPWFLAGGLTIKNVTQAIQLLNPTAVDVSSAVESTPGKKDINLITQFITAVKNASLETKR